MNKIAFIRTGGQTGVERAALDFAGKHGIPILGWCPMNGWAEDMPTAPGIRALFPDLEEMPSDDAVQQARWNVRDSHATLIINPKKPSFSDDASVTEKAAKELKRPLLEVWNERSASEVVAWLMTLGDGLTLNVTGPKASDCPKAYETAKRILGGMLQRLREVERREGIVMPGNGTKEEKGEEEDFDPVLIKALKVAIQAGQVSISLIQRKCDIGYNHAGRIIEAMEQKGYVTPFERTAASRAVLMTQADFIAKYGEWDSKQ